MYVQNLDLVHTSDVQKLAALSDINKKCILRRKQSSLQCLRLSRSSLMPYHFLYLNREDTNSCESGEVFICLKLQENKIPFC